MPNNPRDPLKEFKQERLHNARFFDVDGIKDNKSSYPHMLPSLEEFNEAMSQLGIEKDDRLVVYDKVGNFSAPRVAWTLQTFGHDNVFLLDNYPLYQKYSYPLDRSSEGALNYEATQYKSSEFDANGVLSFEQVVSIVSKKAIREGYNILDARSYGRFTGEDPEPRPGLPSGHAPGSKSLPFTKVLGENNIFLPKEQLISIFQDLKVDIDKPTIVMCGTGVTACILKTALDSAGFNKAGIQVYDGSWTEYAQRAGPELIIKGKD
jgi:thiosulfate/3-mercaptopyruvate sulfurtransferase